MRTAVDSSCAQLVDLAVSLVSVDQAGSLALWISTHGHLIRSLDVLAFSFPSLAVSQEHIAMALRLSKQSLVPVRMTAFKARIPSIEAVLLKALPCDSLTRLQLAIDDAEADFCCSSRNAKAIGQLTALRSLALESWDLDDFKMPSVYLSAALSPLSRLTYLSLSGVALGDAAALQQLPGSLQELSVDFYHEDFDAEPPIELNLGHLNSLTRMRVWALVHPESVLPSNLQWFNTCVAGSMNAVAAMTRLRGLQSAELAVLGEEIEAVRLLTKLTWLTDLQLDYRRSHMPTAALWPKLPGLSAVELAKSDLSAVTADEGTVGLSAFSHLSEIRGLNVV